MEQKIIEYLYDNFSKFVEEYGFSKINEINEEQTYSIEYGSENFVIKIQHYHREFYTILYKEAGNTDKAVALFNLLAYLNQNKVNIPEGEYFHNEKDIEECYKKQFHYISTVLFEYYEQINNFFESENIDAEFSQISEFVLRKHPDLFRVV